MKEVLQYLTNHTTNRTLFVHEYIIKHNSKNEVFIFLNPIFDEKRKSQKFQAQISKVIALNGYDVLRFDYYGTGDSYGELHEFDCENNVTDLRYLSEYLKKKGYKKINYLGIRFGASFISKYINELNEESKVILVDPVIEGKRYLFEQRTKRKIFLKLNNINNYAVNISILGNNYEDFQGFVISESSLEFIQNYAFRPPKKSNVTILTTSPAHFNSKSINSKSSNIKVINTNDVNFWNIMEHTTTENLANTIHQLFQ